MSNDLIKSVYLAANIHGPGEWIVDVTDEDEPVRVRSEKKQFGGVASFSERIGYLSSGHKHASALAALKRARKAWHKGKEKRA